MATKVKEQIAIATPNSGHPNPLISHEKLRQLYSLMLKCRLLDERAQVIGNRVAADSNHESSAGLEATAVGAAIHLRPTDSVAPSHCDFLLSYLKGMPLTDMFSQSSWRDTRLQAGRSPADDSGYPSLNIVLPVPNLTAQLKKCTDIASANRRKKNDNVLIAFSGEGSVALNAWHATLKFAGQRSLPIVFVRQSSPSIAATPDKFESTGDDSSAEAGGYGFPEITVDGKDVVAMYRVAQEAIERARSGGGPTLIDAKASPQATPAAMDLAQYRTTSKVKKPESTDPIAFMERYLTRKNLFSEEWKNEIIAAFQQELNVAIYDAEIDSCGASA